MTTGSNITDQHSDRFCEGQVYTKREYRGLFSVLKKDVVNR